ncbi:SH3 domain-containing protein [Rhizobiaceae bacterium BDR2-2]|uniref:SH3 domain-containing protein n=1 Tax=Ectorhizobium quercum TaxID=2965071 RepID=A0AAE3SX26_9HYPH|nr:SH3 domain-containing protein [Ectorhizobium quercum]MCX8999802.1 SH3 domain-containing protein [Ectorhizobium quercum]
MKFRFLAAALTAFMALPALAEAATGVATANVNMRSGPSTAYPAVTVIPVGSRLEIHGCLASEAWCDVSFARGRGWVSGRYIQATYGRDRVYVDRNYYQRLGIPTIVFDLDTYWSRNYRQRDFYRDRDRWRPGPDRRPPSWNDSRPQPGRDTPRPPRPDNNWGNNPPPPPGWNNPRPPQQGANPPRPQPGANRPDRPRPDQARPDRPRPPQGGVQRPDRPQPGANRPAPPQADVQRPDRPQPGANRPAPQRPPQGGVQRPDRPQPGANRPAPQRPNDCQPGQPCANR